MSKQNYKPACFVELSKGNDGHGEGTSNAAPGRSKMDLRKIKWHRTKTSRYN